MFNFNTLPQPKNDTNADTNAKTKTKTKSKRQLATMYSGKILTRLNDFFNKKRIYDAPVAISFAGKEVQCKATWNITQSALLVIPDCPLRLLPPAINVSGKKKKYSKKSKSKRKSDSTNIGVIDTDVESRSSINDTASDLSDRNSNDKIVASDDISSINTMNDQTHAETNTVLCCFGGFSTITQYDGPAYRRCEGYMVENQSVCLFPDLPRQIYGAGSVYDKKHKTIHLIGGQRRAQKSDQQFEDIPWFESSRDVLSLQLGRFDDDSYQPSNVFWKDDVLTPTKKRHNWQPKVKLINDEALIVCGGDKAIDRCRKCEYTLLSEQYNRYENDSTSNTNSNSNSNGSGDRSNDGLQLWYSLPSFCDARMSASNLVYWKSMNRIVIGGGNLNAGMNGIKTVEYLDFNSLSK